MAITRTKLTYEDYAKTPEGERYELLDGELVMAAAPIVAHQMVGVNLCTSLNDFVRSGGLGVILVAPCDVVLSDTDVVQPDILFVSNERRGIRTAANIQGAPDLVVEILSPSTARLDWNYKLNLYAEHGVREYWLADIEARVVSVLLLGDEGFDVVGAYRQGDMLTSPTLSGFSIAVDDVFWGVD